MQITLRVSTDEFAIGGKRHVALDETRTHLGCGKVAFDAVFGIAQGGAAMGDHKVAAVKWSFGAGSKCLLQLGIRKLSEQFGRSFCHLDLLTRGSGKRESK